MKIGSLLMKAMARFRRASHGTSPRIHRLRAIKRSQIQETIKNTVASTTIIGLGRSSTSSLSNGGRLYWPAYVTSSLLTGFFLTRPGQRRQETGRGSKEAIRLISECNGSKAPKFDGRSS